VTSPVGQRVGVIDADERVRGHIDYVLDLELPRMAVGRILRSPYPHARILGVDASRAESLAGVFAVLTGGRLADRGIGQRRYGRFFLDQTVLAVDRVRFAGEPVAAVAAVDDDVAAEACELIEVEYEPLPAVFDPMEALAPGAPLVHDPRPRLRDEVRSMIAAPSDDSNVCSHFRLRHGSVDRGFAESDFVITDTFRSPAVQHVALEPHVSVASYAGRVSIWSSTQMPHAVRAQLAEWLELPLARVRVITSNLGGGFGSKGSLRLEPVATVLSGVTGRPVKVTLDRAEEFVTTTKHAATVTMQSGVSRDGRLLARKVIAHFNTGAYADVGPMVARNAGCAMAGPYRIPHVEVDSFAVWTNLVPAGAFRGFGVAQGAWAYESHTDVIADRIGIDPIEFRRMNLLRTGDRYATGEVVTDLHFDRLLDAVTEHLDRRPADSPTDRRPTRCRGRAVAALMKATITPSTSTAAVKLNEDGSVNVLTSSVDLGQGAKTALAQLAAEALGVDYERITVSEPDTDLTPYDQQTSSSRTTFSMGNAVVRAADEVKQQLLEIAANRLEASIDDLEIDDGQVRIRGVPTRGLRFGDLVSGERRGNLQGSGTFTTAGELDTETGQGIGSVHWHHGVGGCEVEVDTETGKVEVLDVAASVFAGRVVNPQLCELQVEGSILFGLGQALFEEITYEDGQVVNANLSDYMIPSFADVPAALHVGLLEDGSSEIHGVGETALPAICPAIANAVHDAVGIRVGELPLTPEKVLRAMMAQASTADVHTLPTHARASDELRARGRAGH
jgi:CO/xanthine dehydrogenase Mo-binding subunit